MKGRTFLSLAKTRVRNAGLDWNRLCEQARQIVVYGSRATSAHGRTSDLDLLCIGVGDRFKSKRLHIIWVPESRLRQKRWLGSELATHVAAYGQWIKGENDWAYSTRPNAHALRLVRKRVKGRATAIRQNWEFLLPHLRAKQVTRLRRDLQRLLMMREGNPPVASGTLDTRWYEDGGSRAWDLALRHSPSLAREIRPVLALARRSASSRTR